MGKFIIFTFVLQIIYSCGSYDGINVSKNSGLTKVEFDNVKFQFFGDYEFKKRRKDLLPAYQKRLFSNLGLKGDVYGIGNTIIEPYFSIMILKTDWDSIPDKNHFQKFVNRVGGINFVLKPWEKYDNAVMLTYEIPATPKRPSIYLSEQIFTYKNSIYKLVFWANDRQKNLYQESMKIFQSISHP